MSKAVPFKTGTKRRVYKLMNYNDEALKGSCYPEELQEILDNQYRYKTVLRRRTVPDGTNKLFVRWEGWPVKYNS